MSFLRTVRTWVNLLEREKEREKQTDRKGGERERQKRLFKQTILRKVYREVTQKFVVNKQKRELESFDSFVQLPAIGNRSSPSDAASNIRQTVYIRPMSRNEAIFVQCIFLCSFSCTLDKPEMSMSKEEIITLIYTLQSTTRCSSLWFVSRLRKKKRKGSKSTGS